MFRASGLNGVENDAAASLNGYGAAVALGSGDPTHLAEIRRRSISLAEWWRCPPVEISPGDLSGFESIALAAAHEEVGRSVHSFLERVEGRDSHEPFASDVQGLASRFAGIMQADRLAIGLRSSRAMAVADSTPTRSASGCFAPMSAQARNG